MNTYPQRIVCLTEETTETLYLLGEQRRIVGISGFTVRPPEARREKPKVSAFTSAKIEKILELMPDLVLGFSDLQAEIAAELVRHGLEVHVFNQRTLAEILRMIVMLGGMIGCQAKAQALAERLQKNLDDIRSQASTLARRPRVYFEEWDDPMISAIAWVSELMGIAGGENIFPELANEPLGKNRIVRDPTAVIHHRPDIIIGSWCGKKFRPDAVRARPGWQAIPAVRDGQLHEIKSSIILQPGPAALTDGLQALHSIFSRWAAAGTPQAAE
ncbi:MAG: cobalamin-binding protein [Gammaproteobacteria bacterium]|nr:cobalamin-binding protein [Gammaproteobacteria bacterium]